MRKPAILLSAAAAAALAVGIATNASASVSFDPLTGTGFVGKGDVQVPWGWNNATLQAEAANIKFTYTQLETADYDVTCAFDTGPVTHRVHHVQTSTSTLTDTVTYDSRSASRTNPKGAVTGFTLTNKVNTATTDSDPVPVVNDTCLGNGVNGIVTAVDQTDTNATSTLDASDALKGTGPTSVWANGVSVAP